MASDGAGCGSSERGRSGSEAPVGPGSDRDAALSGDLVVSAGSHDRGCRGGDELCPALDRAVARPLQRTRARGPGWLASAQRQRAERAAPRASGAVARAACDAAVRRWPVDRPQGGALDGRRTRARCGLAPTRLGGPEGDRLVGAEAPPPPSGRGHARGARGLQKKLAQAVAEARAQHPDKPVEVWATDEHRIGLKPIIRRVWAPQGQRPIALGHHRYKWLYVTAFVQPISGETFWYISNGVSKPFFAALLALFPREAGAGRERIIVLELDNAGWHTAPNLVVPDGIRPVYLPPYSPELQPAEHLWPVLDEPLANQYFATLADLEHVVAQRCRVLNHDQLKPGTNFHWWPKPDIPA